MRIGRSTLSELQDPNKFIEIFTEFAAHVLGKARLFPLLSKPRLIEACGAWRNDLDRVASNEPNLGDGLDHLKHAGHLSFWLRRTSPLVEAIDTTKDISDAEGYPLSDIENQFRAILLPYANEYLAFDFGYQIARYYEVAKEGGIRSCKRSGALRRLLQNDVSLPEIQERVTTRPASDLQVQQYRSVFIQRIAEESHRKADLRGSPR